MTTPEPRPGEALRSPAPATWAEALAAVFAYAERRRYRGYSKYDALNSPIVRALCLGLPPLKWAASQAVMRSPVNLRPLLGVRKGVNPKGMGVFALAYLVAEEATGDPPLLDRARSCLDWLAEHPATGFSGACWGYNHEWPGLRFTAPRNFPNLVVTGNCALAFVQAHERTGEGRFLETARGAVEFIRNDLEVLQDSSRFKAYSYVPGSRWTVVNPQGLAATVLSRIGRLTGERDLSEEARRLMNFVIDRQQPSGAWFYADPPDSSPVKHDNYHTGNVLDWVLLTGEALGTDEWLPAYRRGLDFYRRHLFTPAGAPKARHDRHLPYNVHGAAQGAITFARAAMVLDEPRHLEMVDRILGWALAHLRAPDGHFYYERLGPFVNRTDLMRWNQAWMACALAFGIRSHGR